MRTQPRPVRSRRRRLRQQPGGARARGWWGKPRAGGRGGWVGFVAIIWAFTLQFLHLRALSQRADELISIKRLTHFGCTIIIIFKRMKVGTPSGGSIVISPPARSMRRRDEWPSHAQSSFAQLGFDGGSSGMTFFIRVVFILIDSSIWYYTDPNSRSYIGCQNYLTSMATKLWPPNQVPGIGEAFNYQLRSQLTMKLNEAEFFAFLASQ
jgi:hypothetical protein